MRASERECESEREAEGVSQGIKELLACVCVCWCVHMFTHTEAWGRVLKTEMRTWYLLMCTGDMRCGRWCVWEGRLCLRE